MIFWGTFFPLISELFTGEKASLAAPWFNRYTTPLAILLVLFTGIGPLLAWRRVSLGALKRLLGRPALVGLAAAVALFAFTDARSAPLALILFSLAAFSLAALVQEFARGAAAYRSLVGRLLPAGAAGAVLAQPPPLRRLRRPRGARRPADRRGGVVELPDQPRPAPAPGPVGHRRRLPGHLPEADRGRSSPAEQRLTFGSVLAVPKDGKPYATLHPSRNYYAGVGEPARRRPGQELLRGRGDQRGGPQDDRRGRLLDRDAARPRARSNPIINGGRPPPGAGSRAACPRATPRPGASSASCRAWRSARSRSAT